jgi:hypothetical protein
VRPIALALLSGIVAGAIYAGLHVVMLTPLVHVADTLDSAVAAHAGR